MTECSILGELPMVDYNDYLHLKAWMLKLNLDNVKLEKLSKFYIMFGNDLQMLIRIIK